MLLFAQGAVSGVVVLQILGAIGTILLGSAAMMNAITNWRAEERKRQIHDIQIKNPRFALPPSVEERS